MFTARVVTATLCLANRVCIYTVEELLHEFTADYLLHEFTVEYLLHELLF